MVSGLWPLGHSSQASQRPEGQAVARDAQVRDSPTGASGRQRVVISAAKHAHQPRLRLCWHVGAITCALGTLAVTTTLSEWLSAARCMAWPAVGGMHAANPTCGGGGLSLSINTRRDSVLSPFGYSGPISAIVPSLPSALLLSDSVSDTQTTLCAQPSAAAAESCVCKVRHKGAGGTTTGHASSDRPKI